MRCLFVIYTPGYAGAAAMRCARHNFLPQLHDEMTASLRRDGFHHLQLPAAGYAPGDFPAGGICLFGSRFEAPAGSFAATALLAGYLPRTTSPYFGAALRKPRSIIQS